MKSKSSKSSKGSLRKIHNALEGICSTVNNDGSEGQKQKDEAQNSGKDDENDLEEKPEPKIKFTKSKFEQANINSDFINSLDEVKKQFKEGDGDTPKALDTLEEEQIEVETVEDYELWDMKKCKSIIRMHPK